jgi:hypothetical protein
MSRYADLWAEAPDWVEWMTTDEEGACYGWELFPETSTIVSMWCNGALEGRFLLLSRTTSTPDWRDSLERRPRPANPTLCPHCGREI